MGDTPVEVFGRTAFAPVDEGLYHLTLAPYGSFWFVLEPAATSTADESAVPHLAGAWRDVLRRKPALTRALGRWLPQRRWFSAKERTVREIAIEEIIPLRDGSPEVDLIVLRVSFTEGDDHRYSIPVLRAAGQLATTIENIRPAAVIARLDDGALLVDAMSVREGAQAIAAAALTRRTRRGPHSSAQGEPRRTGLTRLLGDDPHDIHLLTTEQSNSSAVLSGQLIMKLVRRLEPSINPDVEVPEHLERAGFPNSPGLAATLELSLPGELEKATAVIVHDAIGNEGDLWTWMLDELSRSLDQRADERWSSDDTVSDSSTRAVAGLLGRRTGELHKALARPSRTINGNGADPGFVPQPFSLLWQRSLLQSLRGGLRATQRSLRRLPESSDPLVGANLAAMADIVRGHPDDVLKRFDELRTTKMQALRIRVHGDLHLGQVLWTGRDVVFIDFEGEPARPMGERSIKRSPLVDVAGLVRSIDYAGRSAVMRAVARGMVGSAEVDLLERWRREWTLDTQQHLIDCYLAEVNGTGLIPEDPSEVRVLLDMFVLEKALYEVRYELSNRPDWVGWPLAAAAELVAPLAVL
jgi:maltose alpha-D-glucosyltransferase/alpha-amylase